MRALSEHGRSQGGEERALAPPPSATWFLKKIDKDDSNWMAIKKNWEQFVNEILTCDSMIFLYLHLKIFV